MDFDGGQMAHVCPKCFRVFNMFTHPLQHHYATKKAMMAAMRRRREDRIIATRSIIGKIERDGHA
jgi:hypothetical protein